MKKQLSIAWVVLIGCCLAAQNLPARAADAPSASSQPAASGKSPDRAAAYYHFALAHLYEEQVATYGRSELANKAIEEYRAAIEADPTSAYLTSGLAELYAKTGRIRDAVIEAQDRNGRKVRLAGTGLLARAMQHEYDHLQGELYLDQLGPDADLIPAARLREADEAEAAAEALAAAE